MRNENENFQEGREKIHEKNKESGGLALAMILFKKLKRKVRRTEYSLLKHW